jgi:hypothetical protein
MGLKYNSVGKYFELTQPIPPDGKRRVTTNNNCCCKPCCELPSGANTYSCDEVRPATCTGRGGTVPAGATSCSPDPCCNGACCFGTSCQYLADVKCAELGGVFKGCGTTCSGGICNPPAAAACSCLAGVSVSASVTAMLSESASCSGTTQSFSGNLVRRFQFAAPTWNIEAANANGYFFGVWLLCTGNGWHTYVGFNTMNQCVLGQDSGGWVGVTTTENPVQGQTVGGVCRLSNGSWTATEENSGWPSPNFGLTLTWSLSFNHV